MAKKKIENFLTLLPFEVVFASERVYVDTETNVVFDKKTRMAIGYIKETHTCMEVNFIFPQTADDEFEVHGPELTDYFNDNYVVVKEYKYIFYRLCHGYILLGRAYFENKVTTLSLKIPRFMPDEIE